MEPEDCDEMLDENAMESQRGMNEALLRCGDVEVECASVLPFLKAPAKPNVFAPFKLPEGVTRDVSKAGVVSGSPFISSSDCAGIGSAQDAWSAPPEEDVAVDTVSPTPSPCSG